MNTYYSFELTIKIVKIVTSEDLALLRKMIRVKFFDLCDVKKDSDQSNHTIVNLFKVFFHKYFIS